MSPAPRPLAARRLAPTLLLVALATSALAAGEVQAGPAEAPRCGARLRAMSALKKSKRTQRLSQKKWNNDPAILEAIWGHFGQEGRDNRRGRIVDYGVKSVFDGTTFVGYEARVSTRGYDDKVSRTVLHLDAQGKVTGHEELGPGRIRTALKQIGDHTPGVAGYRRFKARRTEEVARLIDEYRKANGLDQELADQAADEHLPGVVEYSFRPDAVVYGVSDLHASTGQDNPQEDFRKGDPAMVKWLGDIDERGSKSATLVCGGDCFEFLENVPVEASVDELKAYADKFINGHKRVFSALARAVVPHRAGDPDRGLRVIFTGGNHDSQMVTKEVREHIYEKIADAGGLTGEDRATFRERVAYTGDFGVLGKQGEWVMLHGDIHDPANNWREKSNPFRYKVSRGGMWNVAKTLATTGKLPALRVEREREGNLGYTIVQKFFNYVERQNPDSENAKATAHAMGQTILENPRDILRAGRVLWYLLTAQGSHDPRAIAELRKDDLRTVEEYVKRSRVNEQWGMTPEEAVKRLDYITAQMPNAIHERNPTRSPTLNLLAMLVGGGAKRIKMDREHAESRLLDVLTEVLPVSIVNMGHTHVFSRMNGYRIDRGRVTYNNTGTWTKFAGEDVFTVSVARASKDGRLEDHGLFRYDPEKGDLVKQEAPPLPKWAEQVPWRDQPAAANSNAPASGEEPRAAASGS